MKNMKLYKYLEFIKENSESMIPTYEECVEMCDREDSPFYESKMIVDEFLVSAFNYRLASSSDFNTPKSREMRGICFVFNTNGSLFNRYILLEKFFNLNQVPGSMYSDVKDLTIKSIMNKEDGSICQFIMLPNGKVVGKSKMGFDNEQANGINRIYKANPDVRKLVDWSLSNGICAVFEYVSPSNRIVLRYDKEELILLRLRDNTSGKHIDIKDHLDKIGSIRIAPFEDDYKDLITLIEKSKTEIDKEGWVVQFDNDHMIKIKCDWYCERHGLLTNDLYREHVLVGYILDDKIDDILGQIPEDEKEAHERIHKIISVVKRAIAEKIEDINKSYKVFAALDEDRKEYAINYRKKEPNFGYVMALYKGKLLANMNEEEIADLYDNIEDYEAAIQRCDIYELAKDWVSDNNRRLNISRAWLKKRDPSLFFIDPEENEDDN